MKDNFLFHKNDSVNPSKWQKLVSDSRYATPFQTHQFYSFCNTTPGHRGLVCAAEGNDQTYHALCVADIVNEKGVKSYFSRRAIIYGGPLLVDEGNADALKILLENLHKELKNKVIYIETRNFRDYSGNASVFRHLGWLYIPWLNIRKKLDFQNIDELFASFKYNRRREIQLTLKAGLHYHETENTEDVKKVYSILKKLYKTRTGLPLPSMQYFEDFLKTGLMKLFVVTDRDIIVGGSFCVVLKTEAIFTFYYCGERDYKPKTYPTHLAVLAALEYGMNNGLKYLDFMGAGKPDKKYGVRKYKMEFGGEMVEEGRFLKIENRFLYFLGEKVINFLKRSKMNSFG
jgi:serine/alanine adding enzyme